MDYTIYFSVEESTVYTSHVNKGKLAGVRIEGPDKLCVKQRIYGVIFLHRKVFLFCQGLCQTALRWMNVIKWLLWMIVSKNFNQLIDIKFPCLKLTMTPDWPWQDSAIHQWTPIFRLHFERKVKSMKLSLKWRRTPFPFLEAKIKLKLNLHVIELNKMKRCIHLGDRSFFTR